MGLNSRSAEVMMKKNIKMLWNVKVQTDPGQIILNLDWEIQLYRVVSSPMVNPHIEYHLNKDVRETFFEGGINKLPEKEYLHKITMIKSM